MTFLVKVVDLATTISIATMARHLVEDEDPFSLCMNEWSRTLLYRELMEDWSPYHITDEKVRAFEYHRGKPIVIIDGLPNGVVIGGN